MLRLLLAVGSWTAARHHRCPTCAVALTPAPGSALDPDFLVRGTPFRLFLKGQPAVRSRLSWLDCTHAEAAPHDIRGRNMGLIDAIELQPQFDTPALNIGCFRRIE